MKTDQHLRKYLKDYSSPTFTIEKTELVFELGERNTRVRSRLLIKRDPSQQGEDLVLDGVDLKLLSISLDGEAVEGDRLLLQSEQLTVRDVPNTFVLETEVEIDPAANSRLEGLYLSSGNFCTQCEAEGFRCITYYIDRPDVMSVFTTEIHASREKYPVLLSNGNLEESGGDESTHWVRWHDPFPKPSYLFALVAGDLACIEGDFQTVSGRQVTLQFYTEHHNRDKCDYALRSLQKAMRWDEQVFGLEYDLDLYMVVAVEDFNMGAMENKGLNVFNTKYVLANAQTATDDDYLGIESVIAHEYFHNWTGNRVTCRDWFQLSLKEGLTVFRDQQFSADMNSAAIQRINDVRVLRNHQFAEDAGPMAHPVRPAHYQEINNFYTVTVYNKGAEVVRMMHQLLGVENFRKGMDLYFERHDGQAVTTDDFRQAMQDASGVDLQRFQRWYEQSGTPQVDIQRDFDVANGSVSLTINQNPGKTADRHNLPFHMPMRLSLLDKSGQPVELSNGQTEQVVDITELQTTLEFNGVSELPMISAFRGFSAPVIVTTDLSNDELAALMVCDNDDFNRWDSGQQLATRVMLSMVRADDQQWHELAAPMVSAVGELLANEIQDPALIAEMLILPGEKYLAELLEQVDVHRVRAIREFCRRQIAVQHRAVLLDTYHGFEQQGSYQPEFSAIAARSLRNTCLAYLVQGGADGTELCLEQFNRADNMTDQFACLRAMVDETHAARGEIFENFYQQWQGTALVVDKWFSMQGSYAGPDALERIRPLFEHPDYSLKNPNRARSLLGPLMANTAAFHQLGGDGYQLVAEKIIELDAINPQVSARLANPFLHWKKYRSDIAEDMRQRIEWMLQSNEVSHDLGELLTSSLDR